MINDVKTLRKRLGLSQERFAQKLGVSTMTIRRWESGNSKPSPLAQEKLAKFLVEQTSDETEGKSIR